MSVPKWIALNIAGTFLVSYELGPIIGIVYTVILNLMINILGFGYGVNASILIIQAMEAFLIGILRLKKVNPFINISIIVIILSLISKPIGQVVYMYFNNQFLNINLKYIYINYINKNLLTNMGAYTFSAVVSYVGLIIIKGRNKRSIR